MRVSCVTTEPPRSVLVIFVIILNFRGNFPSIFRSSERNPDYKHPKQYFNDFYQMSWLYSTFEAQLIRYYGVRWRSCNTLDLYSGGPGFKSRGHLVRLGFFRGLPQSSRQMLCWIFITTIHLTIIHHIHKIK